MAEPVNPNERSTFGKNLANFISSKLPYHALEVEDKIKSMVS